jgi:hypothetical protein
MFADGVTTLICLELRTLSLLWTFIETIWFSNKYFIMAELLELVFEQLSRVWDFIGTFFMMFWTYQQRGTIYKYDIGGLLQWQKEEIN